MEKLTEMEQPNWEVPKFGDWDGVGEDPQYIVYLEKVHKGGRHRLYEDFHNSKSAEDVYAPARKTPVEGKSPQHPKDKKSSVAVLDKPKLASTNRHRGSSPSFSERHKKMLARRSPDSKHNTNKSAAGVQHRNSSENKIQFPRNIGISEEPRLRSNPRQNELVIPGTVVRSSGSWDKSDPRKLSSKHRDNNTSQAQSVTDSNSSYHKSPTQIKERNANACCFPWPRN